MDENKRLREYIDKVILTAGSDLSVGRYLGLADGSRVGQWRKGRGRPSELMCIKMARWLGDDPLEVLRLAGYDEMADLLKGLVPETTGKNVHSVALLKSQLTTLRSMIEMAMTQADHMTGDTHGTQDGRHQTPRR